jgi:hypothetical protein
MTPPVWFTVARPLLPIVALLNEAMPSIMLNVPVVPPSVPTKRRVPPRAFGSGLVAPEAPLIFPPVSTVMVPWPLPHMPTCKSDVAWFTSPPFTTFNWPLP